MKELMRREEKKIRTLVLDHSLVLEHMIKGWLSGWFQVDTDKTKLFGNTSSALTMFQKVQLLVDTDLLQQEDIKHATQFFAIRNQLMHNPDILKFSTCFELIDGLENYILKNVLKPDKVNADHLNKGSEEYYLFLYERLYRRLYHSVMGAFNKFLNRNEEYMQKQVHHKTGRIADLVYTVYKDEKNINQAQKARLMEIMIEKIDQAKAAPIKKMPFPWLEKLEVEMAKKRTKIKSDKTK